MLAVQLFINITILYILRDTSCDQAFLKHFHHLYHKTSLEASGKIEL